MGGRKPVPPLPRTWDLLVGGLFLTWFAYLLSWNLALLGTIATCLAVRRSRRSFVLAVLFCPFVLTPLFGFAWGTGDYWRGTAVIRVSGSETPWSRSLDPVVGCPRRAWGCSRGPGALAFHKNRAIRFWGRHCGPMPGGYTGVYPSPEQVADVVADRGTLFTRGCHRLPEEAAQHLLDDYRGRLAGFQGVLIVACERRAVVFDPACRRVIAVYDAWYDLGRETWF